jgi:uncharacterized protein YndB with AHSA1/START domain
MKNNQFVYVSYIATTSEKLWEALTLGELTEKYFFGSTIDSTWEVGSKVTYSRGGEVTDFGEVLIYEPFTVLSFTWTYVNDKAVRDEPTRVTFKLQPMGDTVRLTLKHEGLLETDFFENEDTFEGFNNGWPAILSNLKSLLETGETLQIIAI